MTAPRLLVGAAALALSAMAAAQTPNTLIIVADDVGVDMINCYGEGPDPAVTPHIDRLALEGVLFRNAWANPACSPTRAQIQTGRYSFRTGIGMIVGISGWSLQLGETTLAEIVDSSSQSVTDLGYIGKWHLSNGGTGGLMAPNLQGWHTFSGTVGNITPLHAFNHYPKVTDGVASMSTVYATTEQVDDTLAFIDQAKGPWMCVLAFNAPHSPYHEPPAHLYHSPTPPIDPRYEPRPFYKAMIEAMDTEIGRLIQQLSPEVVANTNVIFIADNGTPSEVSMAPFVPEHAKLTCYEGGVNVPLIASGPDVSSPGREEDALVSATDLFATVVELTGSTLPPLGAGQASDSVSLVPYLKDPNAAHQRETVYAEYFGPNGPTGFGVTHTSRTMRNERWKIIEFFGSTPQRYEFYDLQSDPFENFDMVANSLWTLQSFTAFRDLRNEMAKLVQ